MTGLFDLLLIHPILNLLLAIYNGVAYFNIPYALGFSIIGLTIAIRILFYPLMNSQLKASKKMQDLAPHLSRLKEKHKGDAKSLQQETMKLYKEHGVNPAAGCLPLLLQLPIIFALYSVLQKIVTQSPSQALSFINSVAYSDSLKLTQVWDTSFFGIPLGKTPGDLSSLPIMLSIPLITIVLQFIQTKMMTTPNYAVEKDVKKAIATKKKDDDFAAAFQTQTLYVLPLIIGVSSYQFPVGLSLYWNTFTIFGILQQYKISGLGGLAPWKERFIK